MGRETVALCTWRGTNAEAKILLESQELILRGGIRARILRTDIHGATVRGDMLHVDVAGESLRLELGAANASTWAAAILKPPPSLASKMGIHASTPAFLIGTHGDAALGGALATGQTARSDDAALLIAVLESMADLVAAFAIAEQHSSLPLWCVYAKGPKADPGDGAIRAFMRNAGWMDDKSCSVSERLTATRYACKA